MPNKKDKYNKETVCYCRDCLSLKIKGGKNIPEYCDECSSTNIGELPIEEWESLFKEKNGFNYLEGKKEKTIFEQIVEKQNKNKIL